MIENPPIRIYVNQTQNRIIETVIENPPIRIYVNQTQNRIIFRIKTGYHLEISSPETAKLLGCTKSKMTKEVVFIHCNIVNSDYQQNLTVLYSFVPNKSFGQLLHISRERLIFLKTFNSEFWYTDVWFTDQNSKRLEAENEINITLIINSKIISLKLSLKY